MGMLKCKSCGTQVSSRAATCPQCGDPQVSALTRNRGCGTLILLVVLTIALAGIFAPRDRPDGPHVFSTDDALSLCRQAIKQASINPGTARVSYVDGAQRSDGWTFIWPRDGHLQLQNGFGAMVASSAVCKVDATTHAVSALTIDGTMFR